MVFNSFWYFVFLPLVFLVTQVAPAGVRRHLLLAASLAFYASFGSPLLFLTLGVVTVVTWLVGGRLRGAADDLSQPWLFWLGVGANVATLVGFRYLVRQGASLGWLGGPDCAAAGVVVSVGVSYYVLQALSYLVDVRLKTVEPEGHLGRFALYLAFFPKLLQGPIERASHLLPQIVNPRPFDPLLARDGLRLFLWGLFQKVVLADRLALFVNPVYDSVHAYGGWVFAAATYAFALQIYFDFAAYTDMARGSARLLGIELSPNFDRPYLAASIPDFWRRWHMTFSRWLFDYLFKPLQIVLRDLGRPGTCLAFMVTFLLSGLWHGAAWGFIVWGLLHGLYLTLSFLYRPLQKRLEKRLGWGTNPAVRALAVILTFNLTSFAWIFFRANSLQDAWYVVGNLMTEARGLATHPQYGTGLPLVALVCAAFVYLVVTSCARHPVARRSFDAAPRPVRWACYCLLLYSVVLLWAPGGDTFIYLQF